MSLDPSQTDDASALRLLWSVRPNVAEMTAAAEDAVLRSREPGGWPIAWRLDIAVSIHAMNGRADRAAALRAAACRLPPTAAPAADAVARAFAEKVAAEPRAVSAADIAALRDAGVSDADIVRLCELVAFVSYQARVEAGLALLEAA